jgi:hypothetical protein
MISEEENKKEKELFLKNYSSCFTPYLSLEKLEQKIPSFRYLNDELKKLETTSPESTIKHVMGKKKLLSSKNAKQLCRDGVPIKHIKKIVLKMFNVEFSKDDYENKKKEVLKGREFSDMGNQVPTFCDKSLEELLPFHYLNEQGIEALKEDLWLLNGVLPKVEYAPGIVGLASVLLLFLSKEETYELIRNIMEADMIPGDLSSIRWHFRYNMDDNIKLYLSISLAIVEISKLDTKNKFLQIEKYGLRRIKFVQDIIDQFFLDYINFIGIIKLLPFFLLEGVKGIYRFVYGIISLIHFKIESKEGDNFTQDKKTGELVTLNDKISAKNESIKLAPSEVIKIYKEFSNQYQNWSLFMDTITGWELTHRNNTFTTIKIPSDLRNTYGTIEKRIYIPSIFPNSDILSTHFLPKLWEKIPTDVKYHDGLQIFSKKKSPEADLSFVYNIGRETEDNNLILFLIKTKNGEVFGGIMSQTIKLYDDGKYRIPNSAYLFTVEPELNIYQPKDKKHGEIACFEAGAFRFGNGEDGPAITLDDELKLGWTQKNTIFGNDICLLKDYKDDGEFEIENFEIYVMQ